MDEIFLLLTDGAYLIDNTNFTWLTDCPRGAMYRNIYRRERFGKQAYLNFGGAIHAGLATRYQLGGHALDSLKFQQAAALDYLSMHPVGENWRTPDLATQVLDNYANEYPTETFDVLATVDEQGVQSPLVELPFAVPLGTITLREPTMFMNKDSKTGLVEAILLQEIPIIWTGKIDMVIRNTGRIWLVDHKTGMMGGETYFQQFKLASQFTGYKYALVELLKCEVVGVMINALITRKPTKTGIPFTLMRQEIPITDEQVDEWKANTLRLLGQFLGYYADGYFPMHTNHCRTKWQKACEYLGVCELPAQSRQTYLGSADFMDVTWSPLNEEPVGDE